MYDSNLQLRTIINYSGQPFARVYILYAGLIQHWKWFNNSLMFGILVVKKEPLNFHVYVPVVVYRL